MKRYGNLYKKVVEKENIELAIWNASKGKRKRRDVLAVLENFDSAVDEVHRMLNEKTFRNTKTKAIEIIDNGSLKKRVIHKPAFFPDQIVHWAVMQVIQPFLQKSMYEHSCGSIPKKGSSYGHRLIRKWRRDYKNTKYCLKLDVKKFYPSIDQELLIAKLRNKFKDEDLLELLAVIIRSECPGLPIGNYTSQWLANFFLTDLDWFIKHELGALYYVRYIDDMVVFGPNKRKLHRMRKKIEEKLLGMNLQLKENWQVFIFAERGLDFLGLRFFRSHTILRKRNALKISRKMNRIKKKGLSLKQAQAIVSYHGWIKSSNSYNFYNKKVRTIVTMKEARELISENAKQRNANTSI